MEYAQDQDQLPPGESTLHVSEVILECWLGSETDLDSASIETGLLDDAWRQARALRCWLFRKKPIEFECVRHAVTLSGVTILADSEQPPTPVTFQSRNCAAVSVVLLGLQDGR